jgi:hypothetical protein
MSNRRTRLYATAALLTITAGLTACGSDQDVPSAGNPVTSVAPTTQSAAPTSESPDFLPDGQAPVAQDGPGYQDAIATFGGAEQVQAAADAATEIARQATANCDLWTAPDGVDPLTGLGDLLVPDLYTDLRADPSALLVTLPESFEGHAPASDAQETCEAGQARFTADALQVSVDRANPEQPRLILDGPIAYDLTLGSTEWVISRTWSFGLIPGPDGWLLHGADYEPTELRAAGGE